MSEMDEGTPARCKSWTWFLFAILLVLLTVPVFCVGIALQKSNWVTVTPASRNHASSSQPEKAASSPAGSTEHNRRGQGDSLGALRERIEKIASSAIRAPQLSSKMERVQIQASSSPSISKASELIHTLLRDKKHQFVEAVSPDSIRIVVILPGNEWPALSGSLQVAAEKDGFIYRGPSQTSSSEAGADSMIAEIEILRKGSSQPKRTKN